MKLQMKANRWDNNKCNCFCISDLNNFIMNPPFYLYTHWGIWKLKILRVYPYRYIVVKFLTKSNYEFYLHRNIIIGEIFAAGEISVIMTIGALLEDLTVQKAQSGIENLVKLTPKQARIIIDNKEIMINADDIEIGDIVRVIDRKSVV